MLRAGEYLCGCGALDDLALMKNRNAIANPGNGGEIVRNVENRHSDGTVERAKQGENFGLCNHIERAGRLICDEQQWPVQDGHGDQYALRLAHAHLRRIFAQKIAVRGQRNTLQRISDSLFALGIGTGSMGAPSFVELGSNPERGVQGRERAQQHKRDCAPAEAAKLALGKAQQVAAFKLVLKYYGAFGLRLLLVQKTENRHCQRALARAALADQAQYFAALDFELQIA